MKKRFVIVLAAFLLCAVCVGVTFALLLSKSHPVENSFTAGNITITLAESMGSSYKMTPGVTHKKDPHITVKSGSEACWLFFKAEKSDGFDSYMIFSIADGWTQLDSEIGIYWRAVPETDTDITFPLLLDNKITVKDTVTEQMLLSLSEEPSITFYAYAIQSEGIYLPQVAWQSILQSKEDEE